jgi:hypothetical protein
MANPNLQLLTDAAELFLGGVFVIFLAKTRLGTT